MHRDKELKLKLMQEHSLYTPFSVKDLENWSSVGATVMHKNQIVLVPELGQKWGGVFNSLPNKDKD